MKILACDNEMYLMQYRGIKFAAKMVEDRIEVDGGFDNLAAETNIHPENLLDLIVETIFDKEAKCRK